MHFACWERQCIFEIESLIIYLFYPFLVILGKNVWRFIFRSWASNFGVKHNTQVKNKAKYAKYIWWERGFPKGDHLTKWCELDWYIQHNSWLSRVCPWLALFYESLTTCPCRGGSLHALVSCFIKFYKILIKSFVKFYKRAD